MSSSHCLGFLITFFCIFSSLTFPCVFLSSVHIYSHCTLVITMHFREHVTKHCTQPFSISTSSSFIKLDRSLYSPTYHTHNILFQNFKTYAQIHCLSRSTQIALSINILKTYFESQNPFKTQQQPPVSYPMLKPVFLHIAPLLQFFPARTHHMYS